MPMTPEVESAVEELIAQHSETTVTAEPDGDGGAFITIQTIALSEKFDPQQTWIKFHITVNYPAADVYPHFIDPAIKLLGSSHPETTPMGEGTGLGDYKFAGKDLRAIQISRQSRHLDPAVDTAALKLVKVIAWLESRT